MHAGIKPPQVAITAAIHNIIEAISNIQKIPNPMQITGINVFHQLASNVACG